MCAGRCKRLMVKAVGVVALYIWLLGRDNTNSSPLYMLVLMFLLASVTVVDA